MKEEVGRMKRFGFYKAYYQITNRIYADHIIWSGRDRAQVRRNGQIYTSKKERGILVAAQYFILLATGISFAADHSRYGIIGCAMFLICSLITDFSITKMELLYQIFNHNRPYGLLLYKAFWGKDDDFWGLILPHTKKTVSGFVRINGSKFIAKYRVVFRKKRDRVTIVLSPFGVRIKSQTRSVPVKDAAAAETRIAERISEILNAA